MSISLGIIGGGVMAEAILSRLLQQAQFPPNQVWVSEPNPDRRAVLQSRYGISVTHQNSDLLSAEILMLAIKPQMFSTVVHELTGSPPSSSLVISILAGTSLSQLEAAFPGQPVIRTMPNTPATVGAGMTAIALGSHVQPHQADIARQMFQTVGEVVDVPESLMDAVTGLSGSGPGYVAILIEALSDGGVAAGLPRAIALKLAIQTVKGTAQLLQETGQHPGVLKDQVTSPGGTTIAGIAHLEQAGVRSALIEAVRTAAARSQALGHPSRSS